MSHSIPRPENDQFPNAVIAMVNLKRCENGYLNAVVYGCATDGHFFTFLRMNSDLKVWLFAIVSISVH